MPLQILTLKLDGITAGDYLTWCRDPDPPALDLTLESISIDADPLGDTIIAILDWNRPPPASPAAAMIAGLPLSTGVQVDQSLTDRPLAPTSGRLTNSRPEPHSRHSRRTSFRSAREPLGAGSAPNTRERSAADLTGTSRSSAMSASAAS